MLIMTLVMLQPDKINVLNALGERKVRFPAPHFAYTIILESNSIRFDKYDSWIYNNLKHRYYIGECVTLSNNNIIYAIKIGFESQKELSFFNLACPYLH